MIGWRKMTAFLGIVALAIACVVTGNDLSREVKVMLLAGIGMLGVGNYLEHKLKSKQMESEE